MNARELHDKLEYEHKAGLRWLFSSDAQERETVLRALRLLDAAEANDGSTPETDRLFTVKNIGAATKDGIGNDDLYAAFVAIERERNGLAARVRELERGIEIATDRLTGPGGVLSAIDAARSK